MVQCKQIVLNTQVKKNGTIENTERKERTLEIEIKAKKQEQWKVKSEKQRYSKAY